MTTDQRARTRIAACHLPATLALEGSEGHRRAAPG